MGDVSTRLLQPLARQFQMPKGAATDPQGWAEDYENVLSGFPPSVLDGASKHIITTREARSFPLVAECLSACHYTQESATLRSLAAGKVGHARKGDPAFVERAWINADFIFVSMPETTQALQEDWSWTLHSWILQNQRKPDIHDLKGIRKKGLENSKSFWTMCGRNDEIAEAFRPNHNVRQLINWRENAIRRLRTISEGGA